MKYSAGEKKFGLNTASIHIIILLRCLNNFESSFSMLDSVGRLGWLIWLHWLQLYTGNLGSEIFDFKLILKAPWKVERVIETEFVILKQ